jgi:hypothetical protein
LPDQRNAQNRSPADFQVSGCWPQIYRVVPESHQSAERGLGPCSEPEKPVAAVASSSNPSQNKEWVLPDWAWRLNLRNPGTHARSSPSSPALDLHRSFTDVVRRQPPTPSCSLLRCGQPFHRRCCVRFAAAPVVSNFQPDLPLDVVGWLGWPMGLTGLSSEFKPALILKPSIKVGEKVLSSAVVHHSRPPVASAERVTLDIKRLEQDM